MSNPTCYSRDGKKNWIHICREPHSSVDQPRVKIDIGIKFSGNAKLCLKNLTNIRLQELFFPVQWLLQSKVPYRRLKKLQKQSTIRIFLTFLTILALGS